MRTFARAITLGLTLRGRLVLLGGIALAVTAVIVGQSDLLRVSLLLVVLPFIAAIVVMRTRYRLACARTLEPGRIQAGEGTEVLLRLDNTSALPSGVLLMEDTLPYALGSRPRFVLDRVEPGGTRSLSYALEPRTRGRYRTGPLTIRLTDPFGLCQVQRSFSNTQDLMVTPVVTRLGRIPFGGDQSGGGEDSHSAISAGASDVTMREYRHGDDLRRVHWRSTAKRGELMVRQEESPRQEQATLLLDTRGTAHHGEGQESSFEWAVSALASIGACLHRQGYTLHLVTASRDTVVPATVPLPEALLLDTLADVATCTESSLLPMTAQVVQERLDGVILAVLGRLTPTDAQALARMDSTGSRIAFVLDTATWGHGTRSDPAAISVLRQAGWRIVEVPRGTLLEAAWPRAGAQAPVMSAAQFAGRSAGQVP